VQGTTDWETDPRWHNNSLGPLYCIHHHVARSPLVVQLSYLLIVSLTHERTSVPVAGWAPMETWAECICPLAFNQKLTRSIMADACILTGDMLLAMWWRNKQHKE